MTAKAAQHTPGPWKAFSPHGFAHYNITGENMCLANVFGFLGSPSTHDRDGEGAMNARLIAAAPELLAALQATTAECERYLKDIGDCDHSVGVCCCELKRTIETARAAIASATA